MASRGRQEGDALAPYRAKRAAERTPEPVPAAGPLPAGDDDTFVIQEHHARALHWDFRLERGGVLVSWALPKGLPTDPRRNHLAVQTEDHPLDYASFAGEIPAGEYGGGQVEIWDRGTYECEKWDAGEVKVVLHGARSGGRFALIHTDGKNWLIHLMTDSAAPAAAPAQAPALAAKAKRELSPMLATAAALPAEDDAYGYEEKWDGLRALAHLTGGQLRLVNRNGVDITTVYPELAPLAGALGGVDAILDGEIVATDAAGRVDFGALQPRMHQRDKRQIARLASVAPVSYRIFDLLALDGRDTTPLAYTQRRELLDGLELDGPRWQTPPYTRGGGARRLAEAARAGVEGVVAKRLDSPYLPGRRTEAWLKIKNVRMQEVVIGGWKPGAGNRAGTIGSLLLGIPTPDGLAYVGHVGTGFTRDALAHLLRLLTPRARKTSPFANSLPARHARDARWVTPELVGEVAYVEVTHDGLLRQPSWRGLRPDKRADQVTVETT